MSEPKGYIRERGGRLEALIVLGGRRIRKATGYIVGQEQEAQAFLDTLLAELVLAGDAGGGSRVDATGEVTVRGWGERWIADRRARKVISVGDEESQLRYHVFPTLGDVPLRSLTKAQMIAWVRTLPGRKRLDTGEPISSRYVHHIAGTMRRLLQEAADTDLIAVSPCAWRAKRDLPAKRDVNPEKRSKGGFEGWEVHELISDPAIAWDRRVLWAFAFLTGARPGEVAARRWRDVTLADPASLGVLGRIEVHTAWNSRVHIEKSTKTDVSKVIPIHPLLDAALRAWRDEGWAWYVGRAPEPEDLVVPSETGRIRNSSQTNKRFQGDVAKLALRGGRTSYETRSTFRSLARAGGANVADLNLITHPSPREASEFYNRLNSIWPALCRAVLAVHVAPREPATPAVPPQGAADPGVPSCASDSAKEKSPKISKTSGPPQEWALLVSNQRPPPCEESRVALRAVALGRAIHTQPPGFAVGLACYGRPCNRTQPGE